MFWNNKFMVLAGLITGTVLTVAFNEPAVQEPWRAPEWTDGLKSTLKVTPELLAEGAQIYNANCSACHGPSGNGDGVLGRELPVKPANFHSATVRDQKDGALFWKMSEGRGVMPSYKNLLNNDQRWKVLAYIRQLSPQSKVVKPLKLLPVAGYQIPTTLSSNYIPVPSKITNAVGSELQTFMVDTVITQLNRPWSMAFLPDNRILITERSGNLKIVKGGKVSAKSVGGNIPKGLRDVKIHPHFASNGLIYLSYYIEPKQPDGGYTVLMRGRLNGDELVEEEILYKAGPFKDGGETFGSRIAFDKDGFLYMTVGQRTIDERHRWKTVQDKSNPSGKVLRFNDDGSIPRSNPFVDSVGVLPEIYSFGHRQPQGLIRHPQTGEIWESEHGEMGGSEVNRLKSGANYGWPDVTFSRNYDGTFISPDTARAGTESPMHYWIPSIAPSDFDFVYGSTYPNWNGNLFIGAMVQGSLNRTEFKNGRAVHDEKLLEGIGRIRDVKSAPDGFLYLMIEDTGKIVRLIPLQKVLN